MPNQVKGQITLSSGAKVRLVESAPAGPPYELEILSGSDAMGIERWIPAGRFSVSDVLDILKSIGFLP